MKTNFYKLDKVPDRFLGVKADKVLRRRRVSPSRNSLNLFIKA